MNLAQRTQNIRSTEIPMILKYAKKYQNVLNFGMGEPDFPSPSEVKNAVIDSILDNETYYTDDEGISELREVIAEYYNETTGSSFTKENVIVSPGGTCGLYLSMMAILDYGDEVILFTPHYSVYEGQIKSFGARAKLINIFETNDEDALISKLEFSYSEKTRCILCNFPSNPTGKTLDNKLIETIRKFAYDKNIFIISDEVYNEFIYDENSFSSFATPFLLDESQTIIINSFSKAFSMTGYRVGYVITHNEDIVKALIEFSGWVHASIPEFTQKGAVVALAACREYSKQMCNTYQDRRNQLINGIIDLPKIKIVKPDATFYLFINIEDTGLTSREFAYKFLDDEKVIVVPGNNYGRSGEGFIRVCFATSEHMITSFIEKFSIFIHSLT